ncbi:MAG TPA: winged helix-turn-helix domain-containing protein [Pyrinomonadaceae bacterium]|jgi:DNA-binding winged helix-turn-helix (wHTH) protein/TolB-like protein
MDGSGGNKIYRFDKFVVDATRRTVLRRDTPVAMTSKALDTLLFLLKHHGTIVTKREIIDGVWANVAVEENNLTQQISTLRKAFRENPEEHRFIVTVPGTGYAFIAPLIRTADKKAERSRTRDFFATQGGLGYVAAFAFILVAVFPVILDARRANRRSPATIAVLSFRSVDGTDNALAAGLPYTLTAKLGDLRDVMSVRPAPEMADSRDILAAGRELNVDAVLNGAIQHRGDKIRVTVQMVEVSRGRIVWGENIDADGAQDFSVQDAVATEVIAGLKDFYARD